MEWIFPARLSFDIHRAFRHYIELDWECTNKVNVGDYVYIYIGAPEKAIRYKCEVIKTDKDVTTIDDTPFGGSPAGTYLAGIATLKLLERYSEPGITLIELRANGINPHFSMQSKITIPDKTMKYIEERSVELLEEANFTQNDPIELQESLIYFLPDKYKGILDNTGFAEIPYEKNVYSGDTLYVCTNSKNWAIKFKCSVENKFAYHDRHISPKVKNIVEDWDSLIVRVLSTYSDPGISLDELNDFGISAKKPNNAITLSSNEIEYIENKAKRLTDKEALLEDTDIREEDLDYLEGEDREAVIKARVNHSDFRKRLLEKYSHCLLCGVNHHSLLNASHIIPWAKCKGKDRTNVNNGLLLCPGHDRVFDRGYISFDEDGKIMISSQLSADDCTFINLNEDMKIELNEEMKHYMEYHRTKIFKG